MKNKVFYNSNDSIFVDRLNKVIHLKDRMGVYCSRPPFQMEVVFNAPLYRLSYLLSNDMILCEHCFKNLTFHNFLKIDNFDFDNCQSISYRNKNNLHRN